MHHEECPLLLRCSCLSRQVTFQTVRALRDAAFGKTYTLDVYLQQGDSTKTQKVILQREITIVDVELEIRLPKGAVKEAGILLLTRGEQVNANFALLLKGPRDADAMDVDGDDDSRKLDLNVNELQRQLKDVVSNTPLAVSRTATESLPPTQVSAEHHDSFSRLHHDSFLLPRSKGGADLMLPRLCCSSPTGPRPRWSGASTARPRRSATVSSMWAYPRASSSACLMGPTLSTGPR